MILAVAALVAVGMTSCNNDEELLQGNEAIGFSNVFVDNSTRSKSDPSYTNDNLFEDFAVYGFVEGAVLFNGNTVSKTITNGALESDWKYEGTQYWIAGAKYNFAAIAPKSNAGWTTANCTLKNGAVTTTLSFTNNGTTDLLYSNPATIQGKVSSNTAVPFTFRHLLSKVKFSFTNNYNASNATIRVRDIKINNAYSKGDVTLTSAATTWSNRSEDNKLVLSFGNAATGAVNAEEDFECGVTVESYNELLLIPGAAASLQGDQNAGYKVTFIVDLLINDTYVKSFPHTSYVNFTPAPGNSYDIAATIDYTNIDQADSQEPIEFTVEPISGWGEPNNQNM